MEDYSKLRSGDVDAQSRSEEINAETSGGVRESSDAENTKKDETMEEVIWKLCDKEEAEKIIKHLKTKVPQLLSLCRNPMFLIYTVRVLKESISDPPDTISGIMVSVLQIFSTSYHSDADIKILMKLAYHGMMDNRFTFTKAYVDKLKISYSQLRSLISVDAALVPFQDQVDEDDLRFQFSHQLLQELLAALHLFNLTQDGFDNHVLNVSSNSEMEVVTKLLYGIVYNSRTRNKVSKYISDGSCDIESCKAILMQQLRSYIDNGKIKDEKVISLIHEAGSDVTAMLQPEVNQILIRRPNFKPEWNHVILSVNKKFSQLEIVFLGNLEVTSSMMPLLAENVDNVKHFKVDDIRLSGEIPLDCCEQLGKVLKNAITIVFGGCVLTPNKLKNISEGMTGMTRVKNRNILFRLHVLNDASMDSSCMSHLVGIVPERRAIRLRFQMCGINKEKIEALRKKLRQTEHKLRYLEFIEEGFVPTHEDIASICQILPQIKYSLYLEGWEITEPDIQTLQDALNSGLSTPPYIEIRYQSLHRTLRQDKRASKIFEKQQTSAFSTATSIDANETETGTERGVIEEVGTSKITDEQEARTIHTEQSIGTCINESTEAGNDTDQRGSVIEEDVGENSSKRTELDNEQGVGVKTKDGLQVHDTEASGVKDAGKKPNVEVTIEVGSSHRQDSTTARDKTVGQISDEQESRRVRIEPSNDTCVDEHDGAETDTEQRRRVIDEGEVENSAVKLLAKRTGKVLTKSIYDLKASQADVSSTGSSAVGHPHSIKRRKIDSASPELKVADTREKVTEVASSAEAIIPQSSFAGKQSRQQTSPGSNDSVNQEGEEEEWAAEMGTLEEVKDASSSTTFEPAQASELTSVATKEQNLGAVSLWTGRSTEDRSVGQETEISTFEKPIVVPVIASDTVEKDIGPSGGAILVGGCIITFPKQSLSKKTTVVATAEINRSKWPRGYFAISPMLYVDVNGNLVSSVSVKMGSWCINDQPEEASNLKVYLLHRPEQSEKWDVISELPFTNQTDFTFECDKFSPVVFGILREWIFGLPKFVIQPYLFANLENTIVFAFCVAHSLAQEDLVKYMQQTGYEAKEMFSTISAKRGDKIDINIKCIEPEGFACTDKNLFFKVNEDVTDLKKVLLRTNIKSTACAPTLITLRSTISKNGTSVDSGQTFNYTWKYVRAWQHQEAEIQDKKNVHLAGSLQRTAKFPIKLNTGPHIQAATVVQSAEKLDLTSHGQKTTIGAPSLTKSIQSSNQSDEEDRPTTSRAAIREMGEDEDI